MIYTTYYSNLEKIKEKNIVPIQISRSSPPNIYIKNKYHKLMPTWDILNQYHITKNQAIYTDRFITEILNKLNPQKTIEEIYAITNGNDFAFICYEKPSNFCHRHIIRKWLNKNGIECVEFCDK